MKEIKLTKSNFATTLQAALEVLRRGGTVIYPTETAYGLGADYYNTQAIAKIYQIKKREKNKPLSVLVPDIVSANSLVKFDTKTAELASQYWPGPLTIVLPFMHAHWQKHFTDTLAVRVSSHPFAQSLVLDFGHPLVTTSANISGLGNCFSPAEIKKQFKGQRKLPDLFINAGVLPRRPASTIVGCDDKGLCILRQGEIKVKI